MLRCVRLAALAFAFAALPIVRAAEFRSRPPHVHGLASVDVALDSTTLAITFRAPAINVIGRAVSESSCRGQAAVGKAPCWA